MKNSYIEKYSNKSELEQLKVFLLATDQYTNLLSMGLSPKEILSTIEEPFLEHLTRIDVLDKMDKNEFNYEEESQKYGLDIEIDALAYAFVKSNINMDDNKCIAKNIIKMRSSKR